MTSHFTEFYLPAFLGKFVVIFTEIVRACAVSRLVRITKADIMGRSAVRKTRDATPAYRINAGTLQCPIHQHMRTVELIVNGTASSGNASFRVPKTRYMRAENLAKQKKIGPVL
jgi:hypothetical protein